MAEIINQQARQHEEKPCGLDWFTAKMSQISIERLTARYSEKNRTKNHQAYDAVRQQERDCIPGIDRVHHGRIVADVHQTQYAQRSEPDDHHGSERTCDNRCAPTLNTEQNDQNENRERDHVRLERRCRQIQTFHRREHGNRRRNHRVAEKHRAADNAKRHKGQASPSEGALA